MSGDGRISGEFVRPMEATILPVAAGSIPPTSIVVFGATGDLYHRKIAPALYNLLVDGQLHPDSIIVASSRRDLKDEDIRQQTLESLEKFSRRKPARADWERFSAMLSYHKIELDVQAGYDALAHHLDNLEGLRGSPGHRVFYFAIAPEFFATTAESLAAAGLNEPPHGGSCRIVVEKPFGTDYESASSLNQRLRKSFRERQIYRIDHYLGKETVQNILSFRFGNSIFEPLFNYHYVDHVQITVAETVGMEGRRGQYYDTAGAVRDMLQNHMMQLLSLVAMEPPSSLDPDAIHNEKIKVLSSIRRLAGDEVAKHAVRGQYTAGAAADGKKSAGYHQEFGVAPDSRTETYAALRLFIDNWRWTGVPFFLRTGKRMAAKASEIAIQFRKPPLLLFAQSKDRCDLTHAQPNVLVFRIQPHEGIELSFAAKRPGLTVELETVRMNFAPGESVAANSPEAYERLILDTLRGDDTLFIRANEVGLAWQIVDPVLDAWSRSTDAVPRYAAYSWGPNEANALMHGRTGGWRRP